MPSKDYSHLGNTLRRVRAGERPTEDGGKKVWHQGDKGVEVVSMVDAQGRVLRQEAHLGKEVVIWKAGKPVTTGQVPSEARDASVSRSDLIVTDPEIVPATVFSALSLLKGFTGDDKYLAHLRHALEAVAQGLTDRDADEVVTSMRKKAAAGIEGPEEVTSRAQPSGASKAGFYLAVGSVLLGLICGLAYLAFVNK